MSVEVAVSPGLKKFRKEMAEYLIKRAEFDGLFLPFSKNLKEYLARFAEGMPYNDAFSKLRESKLIPEPIGAWEYSAEPLLKVLPQIKRKNWYLRIYGYGDPLSSQISMKILTDITILTVVGSITGKIDTQKWRELLQKEQEFRQEGLEREVAFIVKQADYHEENICVTSSNSTGEYIVSRLSQERYDTSLKQIGPDYSPTPLDILREEISMGISDERIEELVLLHIKYNKSIIHSRNPDEAYQKWQSKNKKVE